MSFNREEIRRLIFHELKQNNTAAMATKNICATLGDNAVSEITCRRWFAKFRSGKTECKDKTRSGRPTTINKLALRHSIETDPTQTTRKLAADLHSSQSTILRHLHKIGKNIRRSQVIPHELNESQKNRRKSDCEWLLHKFSRGGLHKILTSDEKWIIYDNRKARGQWLSPLQLGVQTPRGNPHQKKTLLCVWWMASGVVHWELLPSGQTVTSDVYCAQLQRVQAQLHQKGINPARICFLQDNARPHVSNQTLTNLKELGWEILRHPPYSPDIAPSDYHLFRSLEHHLRGHRFNNDNDVKPILADFFERKSPEFYNRGISMVKPRWQRVVENNGDYVNENKPLLL